MGALRPFCFMRTKKIALCGILAACYAALTLATASFSYGPVQVRAAEALCLLCAISPGLRWGVTLGCLLANVCSPVSALDLLIGTAATFLGCTAVSRMRRPVLLPLPVIGINAVLVGAELALFCGEGAFWPEFFVCAAQVAAGEAAALYLIGLPLYLLLLRSPAADRLRRM